LKSSLFITLISLLSTGNVFSQGVEGNVRNEAGEAIPFATVYVPDLHHGTIANEEGLFQLSLPRGVQQVYFQYLGYTTEVRELHVTDQYVQLHVVMEVQQYQLPPVTVTASGEDPAYYIMRRP